MAKIKWKPKDKSPSPSPVKTLEERVTALEAELAKLKGGK